MEEPYEIPSLLGEEVALRPMEPHEATLAYRWFLQSDPTTQTCRPPVLKPFGTVGSGSPAESQSGASLGIVDRQTNKLVGRIRFFDLNPRNRSAEIGYLVAPEHRKRGFARAAVAVLADYLFDQLGLNKIVAQTASFNQPSIRLLEASGFKRDGVLREHHLHGGVLHDDYLYSLLARDRAES